MDQSHPDLSRFLNDDNGFTVALVLAALLILIVLAGAELK
jgi:hypothetical protein